MVPPFASEKNPARVLSAPVNAPRVWPNSSASASSFGIAAQLSLTSGDEERALCACSKDAISSFPVPVSPRNRTVTSFGPTRATVWRSPRIAGDSATICGPGATGGISTRSRIRIGSPVASVDLKSCGIDRATDMPFVFG